MKTENSFPIAALASGLAHVAAAASLYGLAPTQRPARSVPISVEIRQRPHRQLIPLAEPAVVANTLPQARTAPRVAAPARRSTPRLTQQPPTRPAVALAELGTAITVEATLATPQVPVLALPQPASLTTEAQPGELRRTKADLSGYLGNVTMAVAARRRYPAMALQLQLEGDVLVRVRLNANGTLASQPTLAESCGHTLLDEEALRMVSQAAPFPALPTEPLSSATELRIPVRFRLES
jgi:protein TonB